MALIPWGHVAPVEGTVVTPEAPTHRHIVANSSSCELYSPAARHEQQINDRSRVCSHQVDPQRTRQGELM